MSNAVYTRRVFLGQTIFTAGAAAYVAGCKRPAPKAEMLSAEEAAVVTAMAEQIIPADQDPGATDLGVIHYIDRQLRRRHAKHFPLYRDGVAALQASSEGLHGKPFTALAWDEQTALLRMLDSGSAPGDAWKSVPAQTFFKIVIDHTMQGFYGSPRHGGNLNFMSFKMLGLDMPDIIGQNRYEGGEG